MKTTKFESKIQLGIVNDEPIYLSPPKWDCGWYWGFGYLGNNNCHYHLDGLGKNKNLYDGLIEHFGKSFIVRISHIWAFAELVKTFYSLKETAEVLGRGGSHYTTNPCAELIKNESEVKRINEIVMPAIFDAIHKILNENKDNGRLFAELCSLNSEGDTKKVVDFMNNNGIHTDDLKSIDGITDHDHNVIHSLYWKIKHENKN